MLKNLNASKAEFQENNEKKIRPVLNCLPTSKFRMKSLDKLKIFSCLNQNRGKNLSKRKEKFSVSVSVCFSQRILVAGFRVEDEDKFGQGENFPRKIDRGKGKISVFLSKWFASNFYRSELISVYST